MLTIINKTTIIKSLLIFIFIICWLSISTSFDDILFFKNEKFNLKNLINFTRHSLVYISFLTQIIIFFFIKSQINYKKNLIFIILFFYFVFQIFGLIITSNSIENISFVISSLTVILNIFLINNLFPKKEKKIIIFISFLILFTVFVLSFFNPLLLYLSGKLNIYGHFSENYDLFLNKVSPRSSGISRSCLILFIMTFILEKIIIKKEIIFKLLKIIFCTVIFLCQSRLIILTTFISFFFIYFFENKFTLKDISKFLLQYTLIPIIFTFSLMDIHANQKYKLIKQKLINEYTGTEKLKEKDIKIKKELPIRNFSESVTSGRFEDWREIFKKIELNSLYIGYGSQADRYLINQSASNGIIYALISSGIFGFLFYTLFLIMILIKLSNIFFNIKKNNYLEFYSGLIILIIFIRSLFETSYAVFGIDLILVSIFTSFINSDKGQKII